MVHGLTVLVLILQLISTANTGVSSHYSVLLFKKATDGALNQHE